MGERRFFKLKKSIPYKRLAEFGFLKGRAFWMRDTEVGTVYVQFVRSGWGKVRQVSVGVHSYVSSAHVGLIQDLIDAKIVKEVLQ